MQPLKNLPGTSSYAVEMKQIDRQTEEARGQAGPGSLESLQRALMKETALRRRAWGETRHFPPLSNPSILDT